MNTSIKVKIVRIEKDLPLPEYKTEGAVAFDIYTRIDALLQPGEIKILPSNLIIEVPAGYMLMIASRSSTPKKGIQLANSVGILDQDYHGPQDELGLFVRNFTNEPVEVKRGDRLGQGIIVPIVKAEWQEEEQIKEESRGGFGSTG